MCNSDDSPHAAGTTNSPSPPTWRQVLHQLNNVFASIHSSLDLVLANEGRPEARSFLLQAQAGARKGALLINELRLSGREPSGWETKVEGLDSRPTGRTGSGTLPSPASLEGSERILLVEDDESVRLLIRAVLTYRGYEIVEACDGDEAVATFQGQGPFDLVIMDLHMPKMDGSEGLRRIRASGGKVPALALSGSLFEGEDQPPELSLESFSACLNKPFENTELVTLVRQLLDRHKAGAEEVPPCSPALPKAQE